MLTIKQVREIREHLAKAQNPVFFFDNDQDGLCSFLLLQRYIGRGKGVAIKTFPNMAPEYFRKVEELGADYIFILDKPMVSEGFFHEVDKVNIPVVWIDHHMVEKESIPRFVNYYNPAFNKKKSDEPVTDLCYQVTKKKEDLWIAVIGCISDGFLPKFYKDFLKKYPDLAIKGTAQDIFYKSKVGKIERLLSFGLKDRTTNVVNMQKFLMKAKTPYELLEENTRTHHLHKRFEEIDSKYQKLLKKAISVAEDSKKLVFFIYGGDMSVSSELANELNYLFPGKNIVVARINGAKTSISLRGKKIRDHFLKAIEGLEGSTGGGHENAVGGQIKTEDTEKFRENIEKSINKK